MEQMIALWSMVKVDGLMVAGLSLVPKLARCGVARWTRRELETGAVIHTTREGPARVRSGTLAHLGRGAARDLPFGTKTPGEA